MCAHFEIVLILFFKYRSIYLVGDLRKYLQVYQVKMTYEKIQPKKIVFFLYCIFEVEKLRNDRYSR